MIAIILCSCSESSNTNEIESNFFADFTAKYKESEFCGTVASNRQGFVDINITFPNTISGLNISYRESQIEISREELLCTADEAYLPESSFPSIVRDILRGTAEKRVKLVSNDGDEHTYNLNIGNDNVIIKTNGKMLSKAEIKNLDFVIEFSNFKLIDTVN